MSVWTFLLAPGMTEDEYSEIAAKCGGTDFTIHLYTVLAGAIPRTEPSEWNDDIDRLDIHALGIAGHGRTNEEDCEAWESHRTNPEGVAWAWLEPRFQRPPLDVAAAADRLREAVERGDRNADRFVSIYTSDYHDYGDPHQTREIWEKRRRESLIDDLRCLAGACRLMAERGAQRVTFAAELL